MIIHVVQDGETADEIAKKYGIAVEKLILDNEMQNPNNLAAGETLVILIPKVTHTVQEGDTLYGIAELYGISVRQLLRNNPYLSDREFIYPGETIVISYETEKVGKLSTYGYAYPYINTDVLIKTLPYLTYITVYSYTFEADGRINDLDDLEIIELAKNYQVAPIMMLNPEDDTQNGVSDIIENLLLSQVSQERFFSNVLRILKTKGYYGVNLNVPYIFPQNRDNYLEFMINFSNYLKSEGHYVVFNTLSLNAFEIMTGVVYEGFDYSKLIQYIDGLFLMTYEWGNYIGIPTGIISFDKIRRYVSEMAERFPADRLYIGIPTLGYMWELPFVLGVSRGIAVTSNAAVELSKSVDAVINYDDLSKTAYFQYILDKEYVVRFKDTRSIIEYLNLVKEFDLKGISIWNIMIFYPQLWLVVNALYDINNIYEDNENT